MLLFNIGTTYLLWVEHPSSLNMPHEGKGRPPIPFT